MVPRLWRERPSSIYATHGSHPFTQPANQPTHHTHPSSSQPAQIIQYAEQILSVAPLQEILAASRVTMDFKSQLYLSIALLVFIPSHAFTSLTKRARQLPPTIRAPRSAIETSPLDSPNEQYFQDLGLNDDLVRVTEKIGWSHPTAVQQLSIPSILEMIEGHGKNSLWCEVRHHPFLSIECYSSSLFTHGFVISCVH